MKINSNEIEGKFILWNVMLDNIFNQPTNQVMSVLINNHDAYSAVKFWFDVNFHTLLEVDCTYVFRIDWT